MVTKNINTIFYSNFVPEETIVFNSITNASDTLNKTIKTKS